MQLYTINATWVRPQDTEDEKAYKALSYASTVATILSTYGIDGFTIYEVQGYWMGASEVSYKIELALTDEDAGSILEVAEKLRKLYNQDAVMVTTPDNKVSFVER